jgi:heptosyltransferase-3
LQRILVIKLRHHGDVLLSTALFRALTEQIPNSQVDVLIYKETLPLLENNPHLNHVLCIDRKLKGFARLNAERNLLFEVRRHRYDAIIHLTDQWIGALLAYFSNAPVRIQLSSLKRDNILWHNCFTHKVTKPPRGEVHAVELNLLCLEALGINPHKIRGEVVLRPSPENLDKADQLLAEHGIHGQFVLIHPAARWPFKCWEDHKFALVVAHLLNRGLHVVLTASTDPFEINMTREIERLANIEVNESSGVLVNLAGKINLPLLAALLKLSKFYVGVDSAPMHMAAALNVPQVALFGPSWVKEWRPWSDKATVIYAGDFGPLPHPDSINTKDTTRFLSAIPTGVVIQAISKLGD